MQQINRQKFRILYIEKTVMKRDLKCGTDNGCVEMDHSLVCESEAILYEVLRNSMGNL